MRPRISEDGLCGGCTPGLIGSEFDDALSPRRADQGRSAGPCLSPLLGNWLAVHVLPTHYGGLWVHLRDLAAQRKETEARALLSAIVESSSDAIISKTLDLKITSWNPAAERLYGYAAAEVIGQSIALLVPADHPDEAPGLLARIRAGEHASQYERSACTKTADD